MSKLEIAVLTALPPLMVALTAWLRAEVANKRVKGKQDKPAAPYGFRPDGSPRGPGG